jgi:protein TonB
MSAMSIAAQRTVGAPTNSAVRQQRLTGIAVAAGLHAAVLAALLSYAPAREALQAVAPIMVSLIVNTPPKVEPARPKPAVLPKPLPLRPSEAPRPAPVLAAPAEAHSPYTAPVPADPPKAAPQASTPAAPAPAATPSPVIAPRFDAAYLDNPAPPYPALARRMGEQGKVVLRVLVSTAGTAERVELRASSGSARLDTTALDTVKRWRFVPARQGSEAVAAWVLVPISFSLQG